LEFVAHSPRSSLRACLHVRNQQGLFFFFFFFCFVCRIFTTQVLTLTFLLCCMVYIACCLLFACLINNDECTRRGREHGL
jgi:hypothetical protein